MLRQRARTLSEAKIAIKSDGNQRFDEPLNWSIPTHQGQYKESEAAGKQPHGISDRFSYAQLLSVFSDLDQQCQERCLKIEDEVLEALRTRFEAWIHARERLYAAQLKEDSQHFRNTALVEMEERCAAEHRQGMANEKAKLAEEYYAKMRELNAEKDELAQRRIEVLREMEHAVQGCTAKSTQHLVMVPFENAAEERESPDVIAAHKEARRCLEEAKALRDEAATRAETREALHLQEKKRWQAELELKDKELKIKKEDARRTLEEIRILRQQAADEMEQVQQQRLAEKAKWETKLESKNQEIEMKEKEVKTKIKELGNKDKELRRKGEDAMRCLDEARALRQDAVADAKSREEFYKEEEKRWRIELELKEHEIRNKEEDARRCLEEVRVLRGQTAAEATRKENQHMEEKEMWQAEIHARDKELKTKETLLQQHKAALDAATSRASTLRSELHSLELKYQEESSLHQSETATLRERLTAAESAAWAANKAKEEATRCLRAADEARDAANDQTKLSKHRVQILRKENSALQKGFEAAEKTVKTITAAEKSKASEHAAAIAELETTLAALAAHRADVTDLEARLGESQRKERAMRKATESAAALGVAAAAWEERALQHTEDLRLRFAAALRDVDAVCSAAKALGTAGPSCAGPLLEAVGRAEENAHKSVIWLTGAVTASKELHKDAPAAAHLPSLKNSLAI